MKTNNEMMGRRFGRLVVVERDVNRNSIGSIYWACKCDCENVSSVRADSLRQGRVKSCGCYKRDVNRIHGMVGTSLYNVWQGMKRRCYSNGAHADKWNNYKENNVSVCDKWKNDFKAFQEWSVINGYKEGLTIERIDNKGNYEPSNCKWATHKEQSLNRSSNRIVKMNGEEKTITQWADSIGISRSTVNSRVNILGWGVVDALTVKVGGKRV